MITGRPADTSRLPSMQRYPIVRTNRQDTTMTRTTTEDFGPVLEFLDVPEHQHAAFLAYVSNVYGNPDRILPRFDADGILPENNGAGSMVDEFEEAYCGEWDSERDFAEDEDGAAAGLFDDIDPDSVVARYFDWQGWARDLFISDYWSAHAPVSGVFVFRNI